MKAPEIKDLSKIAESSDTPSNDQFKSAVEVETAKQGKVVRRSFSLEGFLSDYIDSQSLAMGMEQGKPVNASKALRAILKRDMERTGQ